MSESPSTQSQLAAAYARLSAEGRRPTVRALKSAAHVSTDAAARFLRDVAISSETPAPPDLSTPVAAIWAAAWQAARDAARAEAAAQVDQLTADLEAAADDADQQIQSTQKALAAQQAAERQVNDLQRQVEEAGRTSGTLIAERDAARSEVKEARDSERSAATRADRAEAIVETLQKVLDRLQPQSPDITGTK